MSTLSGRPVDWALHRHVTVDTPEGDVPWESLARCGEVDPELWFPEQGQNANEAKKICAACPVRQRCLEDALAHPGDTFGVRGGKSERERRRLRLEPDGPSVDTAKVERLVNEGRRPPGENLNHPEAVLAIRMLREAGLTDGAIARRYHLKVERYKSDLGAA